MVSHPTMFGGHHRHCSNGDMFSVVDEQDSTSSLKSISLLFIFESTEYVMLISATIEEKHTNNFCQSVQKHCKNITGNW